MLMSDVFLKVNNLIHQRGLTPIILETKLSSSEIKQLSKNERATLIFRMIEVYFSDKQLTLDEVKIIDTLKSIFTLKEGVLLETKPDAIRVFCMNQIDFFLKDGIIDSVEVEKLVSLQDVFDLSYDEFRSLLILPLQDKVKDGLDKELIGENYFLL